MLGSRIVAHLLNQPDVVVHVLARSAAPADDSKRQGIDNLRAQGAHIAVGDLSDADSLARVTVGIDVVVSAVQGRQEILLDGQVALARAAKANGVHRFIPSDFAIDLFHAPPGAPQFDLRRVADAAIAETGLDVVHVLSGAFMDGFLDPSSSLVFDVRAGTANYWGDGDERFNLTLVDDTAHFAAKLAVDPGVQPGVYAISGTETSFNGIADDVEAVIGRLLQRRRIATLEDLQAAIAAKADDWAALGEWYVVSMLTTPPLRDLQNDRYPDVSLTSLTDYLRRTIR